MDASAGRAFIVNEDDNTLSALDIGSGRIVKTVPVGPNPSGLLVDERTQRGYLITGANGDTITTLDLTRL